MDNVEFTRRSASNDVLRCGSPRRRDVGFVFGATRLGEITKNYPAE